MLEKTFEAAKVEAARYAVWEQSGMFAAQPASKKKPFTIMMPPPNVTGSLHVGHALDNTLQDILIRYNRMRGRDALWMPGTDHASIAVHMVLERQLAQESKTRQDIGREAFLKKAWEWKKFSGDTITHQLRRLGITADWGRERFTMDEGLSRAVLHAFVKMYNDKLIYRAKRLVNWDPERLTVISDVEVEQREAKGQMWHLRYPIQGEAGRFITVATTRPETMFGDTAIAVNPEDERYKDLIGKFAMLPIANRPIPIVADDYADPEHGSGAVKITPAHDFNDFEVGKRHNLPLINIFTPDAKLNNEVPGAYQGMDRFEARKKVVHELEALELLAEIESIKHSIPHGSRSGVVIEPYLTDQWYVDTPTLAKPALAAARDGRTKFVPKQYENMYFDWMENQLPWCISRQLWWGHQIPAWYGPDDSIFVAEDEASAYVQAKAKFGDSVELARDPDVLDTWFSSALWPFSTLGWPEQTPELAKYYPGDVLITGFDIITFWVSRMMMFGMYFMGDVPFKDVHVHALIRDAKGQKMSKSKGNVIDPLELIEKYGADALRFTLTAMAGQGRDIRLSEDRVEGYRHFATKLWNATRYCEMNECLPRAGFDPAAVQAVPNRWIIAMVVQTREAIDTALELYRFNDAASAIYQFVWNTFCDWYLEFTKPMLAAGGPIADETRATTGWVLDQILILLNPFMPYVTEELYANIAARPANTLLLAQAWPDYSKLSDAAEALDEMDWLIRMISEIRSIRADMNVPVAAKIPLLARDASAATADRLKRYDDILKRMARLDKIELTTATPRGALQTVLDEATLILPIAEFIDLSKERERLAKEIARLKNEMAKADQKLGNEQFVANAPPEIIEEHRARKVEFGASLQKFAQALAHLEAA